MTFLIALLIGGFALAAAVALVRGLLAFFRDAEQIRLNGDASTESFGTKQNRMMRSVCFFRESPSCWWFWRGVGWQ